MSETTTSLGKRKALRSELFTKDLFEEKDLPPEHEKQKLIVKSDVLAVCE